MGCRPKPCQYPDRLAYLVLIFYLQGYHNFNDVKGYVYLMKRKVVSVLVLIALLASLGANGYLYSRTLKADHTIKSQTDKLANLSKENKSQADQLARQKTMSSDLASALQKSCPPGRQLTFSGAVFNADGSLADDYNIAPCTPAPAPVTNVRQPTFCSTAVVPGVFGPVGANTFCN